MSHTQVQWARGTTAQVGSYTGPTGELVLNTDDWSLQAQDGVTAGGWVVRPRLNVRIVTGAGAQAVNVTDDLIVWNPATPEVATFTLPSSPRLGETHQFKYLIATAPYYPMTVAAPAGQTIDGQSSINFSVPYGVVEFVYAGSNQWVVGPGYAPSAALDGIVQLGSLIGANFNTTSDQAIALVVPTQYWTFNAAYITNPSVALSAAAGGIYTGAGKTGFAIVPASQAYSGLTTNTPNTAGSGLQPSGVLTAMLNAGTVYLSLTTAQGAPATADVRIFGRLLY